jgi:hypothetical protein
MATDLQRTLGISKKISGSKEHKTSEKPKLKNSLFSPNSAAAENKTKLTPFVIEVYNHWQKLGPVKHRKPTDELVKALKDLESGRIFKKIVNGIEGLPEEILAKACRLAVNGVTANEVKVAISKFARALKNPQYKWFQNQQLLHIPLIDFIFAPRRPGNTYTLLHILTYGIEEKPHVIPDEHPDITTNIKYEYVMKILKGFSPTFSVNEENKFRQAAKRLKEYNGTRRPTV